MFQNLKVYIWLHILVINVSGLAHKNEFDNIAYSLYMENGICSDSFSTEQCSYINNMISVFVQQLAQEKETFESHLPKFRQEIKEFQRGVKHEFAQLREANSQEPSNNKYTDAHSPTTLNYLNGSETSEANDVLVVC